MKCQASRFGFATSLSLIGEVAKVNGSMGKAKSQYDFEAGREKMSEEPQDLFTRFGGAEAIARIVSGMYDRVLADPELAGFFTGVQLDRLRKMQFEFISSALDGPIDYTGAELTAIHKGRGITAHHFAKFCRHFADAAEAHGVSKRDVDLALGRLAMYRDKVLGETSIDG